MRYRSSAWFSVVFIFAVSCGNEVMGLQKADGGPASAEGLGTGAGGENAQGGAFGSGGVMAGVGGAVAGSGGAAPGSGGSKPTPTPTPKPDAGTISGMGGALACGPVCAIFCEFGNVPDDKGCPTCKCKPAPVTACKPVVCKLGCASGFKKDAMGCEICECAPPSPCTGVKDRGACDKTDSCRWLEPGCMDPKLATAGCYDKKDLDCRSEKDCSGGRQCLKRNVNTCPPGAVCITCASPVTICQ